MIRSKIVNLLLVVLGTTAISLGVIGAILDPRSLVQALLFVAFGIWCLFGGISNLRRPAPRPPLPLTLRTYAAAKWNAFAIAVLLPACILFHFFESRLNELGIPHAVGVGVCMSFGLAMLGVPVVLLIHRVSKGVHQKRENEAAKKPASANNGEG